MIQEDKEILLKYLCMALPYGVIVDYKENEFELPHWKITTIHPETFDGWIGYDKRVGAGSESGSRPFNIGDVKPCLRPMLSMTDEEKEEMHNLLSPEGTAIYGCGGISMPMNHYGEFVPYEFMNRIIQYLLKNHFDFMGLIPKGLAIEVTKDNNPYEQNKS